MKKITQSSLFVSLLCLLWVGSIIWILYQAFSSAPPPHHVRVEPSAAPVPSPSAKPTALPSPVNSIFEKYHWIKPAAGKITNAFGNGYFYFGIYRGGHTGIDLKTPTGSPVWAAEDGQVVKIHNRNDRKYGLYVILKHPQGIYSLYGHLKNIKVKPQQKVSKGDPLGEVGITGAAGYPHLHFEITNQIPIRDGAYGYYYICKQKPPKAQLEDYNFVNQYAMGISSIYRNKRGICKNLRLHKPLVYFNPELFYTSEPPGDWPLEIQPENEELAWKKKKQSFKKAKKNKTQKHKPQKQKR